MIDDLRDDILGVLEARVTQAIQVSVNSADRMRRLRRAWANSKPRLAD